MNQNLFHLVLTVVMYSIVGLMVGVGITVVRKYPQAGEFLKQRPILGWTLAFALGSVILTGAIAIFETVLIAILTALLSRIQP